MYFARLISLFDTISLSAPQDSIRKPRMTLPSQSLAGKVAVVSVASSGIGAAIVRELSRRGASVVINYRSESEKNQANEVLQSLQGNSKSIMVQVDLSTIKGPSTLAEASAEAFS
jgi:NAD(P)-dependent dehydrogenase (short-subunit alcohol dehydrogenase family)